MKSIISLLTRMKFYIDNIISWVLIIILATMTILVTYQVIVRYIFDSPSAFSEVLSRYLFVWLIMLGSSYVFGLREHMAITFLKEKFPYKIQILIEMIIELATTSFALFIMILGGYSSATRQMFQIDSALQIPMGYIYGIIPFAGALIIYYCLYNEINLLSKLFNNETKKGEM